jgi:serine/threonine protein kinase
LETRSKLADFSIGEFISKGSEGAVFECSHPEIDLPLVLKMTFNLGVTTRRVNEQFRSEIELKDLPFHPHVASRLHDFEDRPSMEMLANALDPKVFDCGVHYDVESRKVVANMTTFLVMKRYPHNLHSWLVKYRKHCSIQVLLRICSELCDALIFLWETKKIVHLDLRLANVLMDENAHVVLCDFGFARKLAPDGTLVIGENDTNGGNRSHLAPEVLNVSLPGKIDYSKQTSFSLGILIHEIFFGMKHPFHTVVDDRLWDYPVGFEFGGSKNVRVPDWNPDEQLILGHDPKLINLIANLIKHHPGDRMALDDCRNELRRISLLDRDLEYQYQESLCFTRGLTFSRINQREFEDLFEKVLNTHVGIRNGDLTQNLLSRLKQGDVHLGMFLITSLTFSSSLIAQNSQQASSLLLEFVGWFENFSLCLSMGAPLSWLIARVYYFGQGVEKDFNKL